MILHAIMFMLFFVTVVLTVLYISVFGINRKRKLIAFDAPYEKVRGKNYPPPYPNGWFSLCSSDSVKKGRVIEVDAFGQKLAVFRGENGQVGVMDAYCPHLNANLAYGRVKDNHLVCPFHGWEFNTKGECAKIPYCDKLPVNKAAEQWIVKEDWGLILVWHHSDKKAPDWSTEGHLAELKDYKYHGMTSEVLRIHLQDFAENGADFAHFNFVHNLLTIPFANRVVNVKHTVKIEFGQGDVKHMASFSDQADLIWKSNGKEIPHAGGNAVVTFFGPGFLVFNFTTKMGNMLLIKTFTPMDELKVKMEDYVYAPRGTFKLAIKYLLGEASAQFQDDVNIWERKKFAIKPQLVKGDGPIMKMRAWYSQFYSEHSAYARRIKLEESVEPETEPAGI
jgi:cholesterol 7-dehydrogenase